jgi:uncharacterized protein
MVRPRIWISSITIGCALTCAAVQAQTNPAAATIQRPVDYVVDLQADDGEIDGAARDSRALRSIPSDDGQDAEVIKERYSNGSTKIERQVTQDANGNYVNHGSWKMWNESGQLVVQGEYENGNRTGTWVRWYRGAAEADLLSKVPYQQFIGPFISQATFKHGQLDGTWTIYDSKMHKISQWSFVDGKRHGDSTLWHASGRKMREIQYRDGDMDGQLIEWNPDGTVKAKEIYQSGRKLAEKVAYHTGQQKKSAGTYLFAKLDEKTPDDWWNCKPLVTTKTGKDEKHGPMVVWHPNGNRQLEGTYEHDLQVGQFNWWHANGQKALEGRYDHGKQDGEWTWWYASGQKSIHGEYVHGSPSGRWTWWKEDGKVAQSADLSGSDGVVIETPRTLDPSLAPRVGVPSARQPLKR